MKRKIKKIKKKVKILKKKQKVFKKKLFVKNEEKVNRIILGGEVMKPIPQYATGLKRPVFDIPRLPPINGKKQPKYRTGLNRKIFPRPRPIDGKKPIPQYTTGLKPRPGFLPIRRPIDGKKPIPPHTTGLKHREGFEDFQRKPIKRPSRPMPGQGGGNPSSIYAESLGLISNIVNTPSGQRGIVTLPSGQRVDAWKLYRGEVPGYPGSKRNDRTRIKPRPGPKPIRINEPKLQPVQQTNVITEPHIKDTSGQIQRRTTQKRVSSRR